MTTKQKLQLKKKEMEQKKQGKLKARSVKDLTREVKANKKIESTGWNPKYSLDDGIKELIMAYQIIINNDASHFRNGFPLTYGASL